MASAKVASEASLVNFILLRIGVVNVFVYNDRVRNDGICLEIIGITIEAVHSTIFEGKRFHLSTLDPIVPRAYNQGSKACRLIQAYPQ